MKCWSFFMESLLGAVVLGIRGSPLLGKLLWIGWNQKRTRGMAGWERDFIANSLLEFASQPSLRLSFLAVAHTLSHRQSLLSGSPWTGLWRLVSPHQLVIRNGGEERTAIVSPPLDPDWPEAPPLHTHAGTKIAQGQVGNSGNSGWKILLTPWMHNLDTFFSY